MTVVPYKVVLPTQHSSPGKGGGEEMPSIIQSSKSPSWHHSGPQALSTSWPTDPYRRLGKPIPLHWTIHPNLLSLTSFGCSSGDSWRGGIGIRWCMTRWTPGQASPPGGRWAPRWESIRIIVSRWAAALWPLQMLSAQLPDLLMSFMPHMLHQTRVRYHRNNFNVHVSDFGSRAQPPWFNLKVGSLKCTFDTFCIMVKP